MIKTITLPRPRKKQTNISRCPPSRTMDDVASIQFQFPHIEEYFSYHEEYLFPSRGIFLGCFCRSLKELRIFSSDPIFSFFEAALVNIIRAHCARHATHVGSSVMIIIVLASSHNITHTCIQDNLKVSLLENLSAHS